MMPNPLRAHNHQHLGSSLKRLSGYLGWQGVGKSRMLQASQSASGLILARTALQGFRGGRVICSQRVSLGAGVLSAFCRRGVLLHTLPDSWKHTPQVSDHLSLDSRSPGRVWGTGMACICWKLVSQKPDVFTAGARQWGWRPVCWMKLGTSPVQGTA